MSKIGSQLGGLKSVLAFSVFNDFLLAMKSGNGNDGANTETSSIQPPSYEVATGNQQSSNNAEGGNIAPQ
ncbi:hypothetical protein C1646_757773 [Rhizophagus diaphanus]|nr:hypothetical protein C1646_757773 [Rhizophagus diaphanus] [Rhizophagus sp. MUCL 43196]